MKTWIKTSIAAAVIAVHGLGASVALARGGDCEGPRGGAAGWHRMAPEQMQQRMQERTDLGFARLELALALLPEQKAAWDSFKAAMSERAAKRFERMTEAHKAEAPKTTPERLQRMEELGKLHQAELAETRRVVEAFYAQLSEAQKKVFDADFGHAGKGGPRGGVRGGHGPHHHGDHDRHDHHGGMRGDRAPAQR